MYQVLARRWGGLPAAVLLSVGIGACSTPSTSIPPALIGADRFTDMSCEQLRAQQSQHTTALNELNHPALFSSKSEQQRAQEISEQQGTIKAIESVEAQKDCTAARDNWASHPSL